MLEEKRLQQLRMASDISTDNLVCRSDHIVIDLRFVNVKMEGEDGVIETAVPIDGPLYEDFV